jgi:hypothetical protein
MTSLVPSTDLILPTALWFVIDPASNRTEGQVCPRGKGSRYVKLKISLPFVSRIPRNSGSKDVSYTYRLQRPLRRVATNVKLKYRLYSEKLAS